MSTSQQPDPLQRLSEALGSEYDQSRDAQRERILGELDEVIARVPEQTEFTNSRRFKVWGPVLTLFSLGLCVAGLYQGSTGLTVCGAVMVLVFALMTWQHREAGQHVFMRLTRRQLIVDSLSAPVELADIMAIQVKDEGLVTQQKLMLTPTATLPTHRARLQLFGNQAMALKKPQPHICIHSAGLMTGGRKLSCAEIIDLLTAYRDAACAQQQLDILR